MNKKIFFLKFIPSEIIETTSVKVINGIIKFLINYLLALLCGPVGKGIIAFAELIFNLLFTISNFSIFKTLPHFLFSKNFLYSKKILLKSILIIQLLLSILCIIIFFLFYNSFNYIFSEIPFLIIFLFIFMVPIKIIIETLTYFLQCLNEIHKVNFLISIRNLFIFFAFIFFLLLNLKLDIFIIAFIYFFSLLLLLLLSLFIFKKITILEDEEKKNNSDKNLYLLLIKNGSAIHIGYISSFLFFYADQFMIKYFCSVNELGFYSFSINIFSGLLIFAEAIQFIFIANASALVNNKLTLSQKFLESLFLSFIISVFVGIIIYFLAPILLKLFLPQFIDSFFSLKFLLPGLIFFSMALQCGSFLITNGFFFLNSLINFFIFFINIILNFLLIPKYKSAGAAIASSISYFFLFIFYFIFILQKKLIHLFGNKPNSFSPNTSAV